MNAKEAELVVVSEDTYNLCTGGQGGFGHINSNALNRYWTGRKLSEEIITKTRRYGPRSDTEKLYMKEVLKNSPSNFTGKQHSTKTIDLMKSIKQNHGIGETNSQFGTFWITDGTSNRKIRSDEPIPENWYKGRIIKHKTE